MGAKHTRLDCWKRGRKGLLITMGDEPLNPYLPMEPLRRVTGDSLQADVETGELYREAAEKYEIHHLHVSHSQTDRYREEAQKSFGKVLPRGHLAVTDPKGIADVLVRIISAHAAGQEIKRKKRWDISWDVIGGNR